MATSARRDHRGAAPLSSGAAALLVLAAAASVQSGAAIAARLFPEVGPGGALLLRLVLSAVVLWPLTRPAVRTRARGDLAVALLFGVVLALMNGTFYLALDRIPLGIAVTVEFIGPLALSLSGARRALDVLWVLLAAAGVVLLASGGDHVDVVGLALALVAGGCWAAYIVLSKRVGAIFPGASGLAIALTVGTVGALPWGLVDGGSRLADPSVLGRGLAVAVLSSALPYSLELFALRRLRASVFGVLMSLDPAVAALSGLAFLGQHLSLREWLALGCVVAASIGVTRTAPHPEVPVDAGATPPERVGV